VWGGCGGVKPATIDSLRDALESNTVGLYDCAKKLVGLHQFRDSKSCEENEKPLPLQIAYQSHHIKVAEGRSTLVVVQVAGSRGGESFQWSKDGQPLHEEENFSGVSTNMLYISRAHQSSEGNYSCTVSSVREIVCSNGVCVEVVYPVEKNRLLEFYHCMKRRMPVGLPFTFVDLVLIKQAARSQCDYTIRGDVDDILENKEVAVYEEIFKEYKEGELVLVEGRPGCGKTTLVHTQDWAQGKPILQGAKYVFFISLKLWKSTKHEESLCGVLVSYYGSSEVRMQVEQELLLCGGKGSCFIIDGLDEYQIEKEESVIYQIIRKECLPSSMVIVASRPSATSPLRDESSRRVAVVGFTKEQVNTYVNKYPFERFGIKAPDTRSKLEVFLDRHSNVHHMCYLPVHAAMICFLFSIKKGNIPHTETEIYEEFTLSTLLRHKQRYGKVLQIKSLEEARGRLRSLSTLLKVLFLAC